MVNNILHLADVHLKNNIENHEQQSVAIENSLDIVRDLKPSRIVIAGDLFHDFIKPTNEAKQLAGYFLNELAKISKVIITMGNHDYNAKAPDRIDSIRTIIDLIQNKNVIYYSQNGFYEDENIVWVVWHHASKTNPWTELNHVKDDSKLYVDIFHDPIFGCKTYFGQTFEDNKYISLKDFQGDLLLLGDIHQRQFFSVDGKIKGAYPSSLNQTEYGESPDKHGFILWNVSDKNDITYTEHDVENDYVYLNYYLDNKKSEIDYDNLDITLDIIKPKIYLKIHWTDFVSNIKSHNKRKITTYIKNKYPQIVTLIYDETKINNNKIKDDDIIQKSLKNISSKDVQQEIFRKFLSDKKYDNDFIEEVINIDNKINNRLQISTSNERNEWRLVSFYLENYRSHGDRFHLDWDTKNGIWQVKGQNAVGKTNLLSSICYLFYGKTLETLKRESSGDNRFINNKRDLDFCEAGGIIEINQHQKIELIRRTERKWDRKKEKITGTPTTLSYNIIDDNGVVTNLTDEEKTKTQKLIEDTLGTFDDFLRTSLVNADTLNGLLSMDESEFMDSILKDAGLDIFDKKLKEYKDYKKELYKKEEKIILDVTNEENKVIDLLESIKNKETEVVELKTKFEESKLRVEKGNKLKEDEIKKLHQIDEKLISTSITNTELEIETLSTKKDDILNNKKILEQKIEALRSTYDIDKYNLLTSEKDSLKDTYYKVKSSIKDGNNNIDSIKNNISRCNGNKLLNDREITSNNSSIEQEKVNINNKITLKNKEIENVIININNQINNKKTEISLDEKSKTCSKCEQLLKEEQQLIIQNKINEKLKEIDKLELEKTNSTDINTINESINKLKEELVNGNSVIESFNKNIKEKQLNSIEEDKLIENYQLDIKKEENDIEKYNKNLESISVKQTEIEEQIVEIEKEKQELAERNKLINEKTNIPLQIENIDLKINALRILIDTINKEKEKVIFNDKIQLTIDKYSDALISLNQTMNNISNNISYIENNEITSFMKDIRNIQDRIEKYKIQEREESINKVYTECISRDGIPRLLILRMRDDINYEISTLLKNVDFDVYFDENMVLKMFTHDRPDSAINVIGGSGMERSFISVILRLALRSINNKSIGNILFLDEVTSKLVGESVTKFFNLLNDMTKKIEKIIIIEHAWGDELNPDHIIEVKQKDGISEIKLIM